MTMVPSNGVTGPKLNMLGYQQGVVDVQGASLPPCVAVPTLYPAHVATLALDVHLRNIKSTRSLPGKIRAQSLSYFALSVEVASPVARRALSQSRVGIHGPKTISYSRWSLGRR